MSEFRFLGKSHRQSLLDFEGDYVHATSDQVKFSHQNAKWLKYQFTQITSRSSNFWLAS
ncbi:MAG: hypothetical protein HRU25_03010 [Psychrobium sp.]|nr:hypothetical protein [Psychrobium sp.]